MLHLTLFERKLRRYQLWAANGLEFLHAMEARYPGCLNITSRSRPDLKTFDIAVGPNKAAIIK